MANTLPTDSYFYDAMWPLSRCHDMYTWLAIKFLHIEQRVQVFINTYMCGGSQSTYYRTSQVVLCLDSFYALVNLVPVLQTHLTLFSGFSSQSQRNILPLSQQHQEFKDDANVNNNYGSDHFYEEIPEVQYEDMTAMYSSSTYNDNANRWWSRDMKFMGNI